MTHRYTGAMGKRFEGNLPRAHEVQGTARLLVQQCIDHINHNGGWGQMSCQLALRDGTIVKAIVLKHQRGWEPIVRVEVFAPQGTEKIYTHNPYLWESGFLSWGHPIDIENDYPLIINARGQLADYLWRNDYESKVYINHETHVRILGSDIWGDATSLLDPRLVASQYSGWMRLLIQTFASTGRRLDEVFNFPYNLAIHNSCGLLLSPQNEFWFVHINAAKGVVFTKAEAAIPVGFAKQYGTDWVSSIEVRMRWCEVLAGLSVTPLSQQIVEETAASEVYANGRQFVSSVHTWQWSRQQNQGAVLVFEVMGGVLAPCWEFSVFVVDITWNQGALPSATITRKRAGKTYLHHGVFLWTATTVYGQLMLHMITSGTEIRVGENNNDLTDPVPVHIFYDRESDTLQELEMFPVDFKRTDVAQVVSGTPDYFYRGANYGFVSATRTDRRKGSFLTDKDYYVALEWPKETFNWAANGAVGGESLDYNYNWSAYSTQVLPYGFNWPDPHPDAPVAAKFHGNMDGLSDASINSEEATWLKVWRSSYGISGERFSDLGGNIDYREALVISAFDATAYLHITKRRTVVYPAATYSSNAGGGAICRAELWERDKNGNFKKLIYAINDHETTYSWPSNVAGNFTVVRDASDETIVTGDIYFGTTKVESIDVTNTIATYWEPLFTYNNTDPDSFFASAGLWYGFESAGGVKTYNHAINVGLRNSQGYPSIVHSRYSSYGIWIGGA